MFVPSPDLDLRSRSRRRAHSQPGAAAGTLLRTTATASGTYFISHTLLAVAGLVSMPIMTRLLSKEDYGLLGLTFAVVSVLAVIAGCGLGEASVRMYSERRAEGVDAARRFCETMLCGASLTGILVGLGVACFAPAIAGDAAPEYTGCLRLGGLLIAVRAVSGVLYQIYRAQERPAAHATAQVVVRYATTALAIPLLLLSQRTALMVLIASAIVELTAVGVRLVDLHRHGLLRRLRLEPHLLGVAASYGVPLAVAGAARFLLDYGDRFVIERLLGLGAVATYGVACDVAARVIDGCLGPLQLAAVPILLRSFSQQGSEAAARFASRLLSYTIALVVPLALLYYVLNQDLIELLASAKYRQASALTPWVLPGFVAVGLNFIAIAGLTIAKRTTVLACTVGLAALFNLGLNLLLVPRFGLTGAAIASTLAYMILLAANYAASRQVLALRIDATVLLNTIAASAMMLLVVWCTTAAEWALLPRVAIRGALGTAAIALTFAVLDNDLRRWCRDRLTPEAGTEP